MERTFYLDYNETLPITITLGDEVNGRRECIIDADFSSLQGSPEKERLRQNLLDHLAIQGLGGSDANIEAGSLAQYMDADGHIHLAMQIEKPLGRDQFQDLKITYQKNGVGEERATSVPLIEWDINDGGKAQSFPLTVTETRQLANQTRTGERDIPHAGREAMARLRTKESSYAHLRPHTDLHSHLSAQIKPKELLRIAVEQDKAAGEVATNSGNAGQHGEIESFSSQRKAQPYKSEAVYYPLELLALMGIKETDLEAGAICNDVPPVRFDPVRANPTNAEIQAVTVEDEATGEKRLANPCRGVRISSLTESQLKAIQEKITIPATDIVDFGNVEMEVYRFGNFLTKNPNLVRPMILEVARDYAEQGVTYTEQAVTDALNPAWLKEALPALEQVRKPVEEGGYGVDMRILVGIPRSLPPEVMLQKIEQVKQVADCPYIAGVDFLGYEMTPTKNFSWALTRLARWAKKERPGDDGKSDFIIRVHAGENGKNDDNVLDAMKVSDRYQVPIRIGHGVHFGRARNGDVPAEFTEYAERLGENGLLAVEFNMDSNIALHNIDTLNKDVPWKRWQACKVPCVLSSDGAGIYQTDVTQITAAAFASGMGEEELKKVREFEDTYIENQKTLYRRKLSELPDDVEVDNYHETYKKRVCDGFADLISGKQDLVGKTPILLAGAGGSSWDSMSPTERIEAIVLIETLARAIDPEKSYFVSGRSKDSGVAHALDITYQNMRDEARKAGVQISLPSFKAMISNAGTPSLPKHITHFETVGADFSQLAGKMIERLEEENGYGLFIHGSDFTRSFIMHADQREMGFALMTGVGGASESKAQVIAENSERGVVVDKTPVDMIRKMMETDQLKEAFKAQYREPGALEELEREVRAAVMQRNEEKKQFKDPVAALQWVLAAARDGTLAEEDLKRLEGYANAKAMPSAPATAVAESSVMGMLQEAMSGKISL